MTWKRRQVVSVLAGGAIGTALGSVTFPRTDVAAIRSRNGMRPITDRVAVLSGAKSNVVVAAAPDSLLMVDSGAPGETSALLSRITETFGERPITSLFNTHWHLAHTGGNAALGRAGVDIIAQDSTKQWMKTKFYVDWQDRRYQPRPASAVPNISFYEAGEMTFGNGRITYGHLPKAHTDGDIYVFFPDDNVLVAGDVIAVGHYPVFDYVTGGGIEGMIDATTRILELTDSETRIVPGRGPVQNRAHVQAQNDMLATVFGRMDKMMSKGMSAREIQLAGATEEFDEAWGNPTRFLDQAYESMYWRFGAP